MVKRDSFVINVGKALPHPRALAITRVNIQEIISSGAGPVIKDSITISCWRNIFIFTLETNLINATNAIRDLLTEEVFGFI